MTATDPIDVARAANDAFASIPFERLRALVLEAETYDDFVAAANRDGFDLPVDMIDPNLEVQIGAFAGGAALAGGGGKGQAAWHQFWREWLEPWEELEFEGRTYEAVDAMHVLVDAHVSARGRLGGVPAELDVWQVWGIQDGRVVLYAVHPSRDLALQALGGDRGDPG